MSPVRQLNANEQYFQVRLGSQKTPLSEEMPTIKWITLLNAEITVMRVYSRHSMIELM